jgi:hypothetical protein
VDTFILLIALLVGHRGDQFLVDTTLDVGKIDGLHGQNPFPNLMTSVAAEPEGRPALDRAGWNGLEEASACAAVQGEGCAMQRVCLGRQQLSYCPADLVDGGQSLQR